MNVEFKSFCVLQSDSLDVREQFVGVKFAGGKPQIFFPYGCFQNFDDTSDEEIQNAFSDLMKILSDHHLVIEAEHSNCASSFEFETKLDFPLQEFFFVLNDYLNFGLFKETEKSYKRCVCGKVNWNRTIKQIRPHVVDGESGSEIVYLNLISRCDFQNENQLVSLIHEFCVAQAQKLIGPLYGVEADVESTLDFDYELFSAVLNEKCSKTFNDRKLRLFHSLQVILEYLQGNTVDGTLREYCYGVSSFAPIWEKLLDRIFGNLHRNENKECFNPHCEWRIAGGVKNADDQKFAMRPDTIMRHFDEIFVIDAKFYTKNRLPSSSSISKQIVYAEFVEQKGFADGDKIFNVFLLPCCCKTLRGGAAPGEMNFLGTAVADWTNGSKPYHNIVGIQLDVKSVMRDYRRNEVLQFKLAEIVKNAICKEAGENSADETETVFLEFPVPKNQISESRNR